MAKILVVYDSRSGNTEKMASAIADGAREVKRVNAIAKKASQTSLEDLIGADGIIMGSPTYYGLMSGKLNINRQVSQNPRKTRRKSRSSLHEFRRSRIRSRNHSSLDSAGDVGPRHDSPRKVGRQALWCRGSGHCERERPSILQGSGKKSRASSHETQRIEPCTASEKTFVIAHLNSRFINLINTSKPKDQQWSISTPNETSGILLRDRFCSRRMCNTDRLVPDVHGNCFE